MKIIRKKMHRGEVVDVDRLVGKPTPPGGIKVSALGTTDGYTLKIAIGTDREIEAAEKAGEHFDATVQNATCDDCGKEIKGEAHFGPTNTEDETKPFIPQWCGRCAGRRGRDHEDRKKGAS
jgi:hypothetical protein